MFILLSNFDMYVYINKIIFVKKIKSISSLSVWV